MFFCNPILRLIYMTTLAALFICASVLQIWPEICGRKFTSLRVIVFGAWFASGLVPVGHWYFMLGGWQNLTVQFILPRFCISFMLIVIAFCFYISKFPERIFPGTLDYFGNSHQWWHVLIFLALASWHSFAVSFAKFHSNRKCDQEQVLQKYDFEGF